MFHNIECKTRGIVHGTSILKCDLPISAFSLIEKNVARGLDISKKEYEYSNIIDPRNFNSCIKTWKIELRSRESKEIVWVRPFVNLKDALVLWSRLISIDVNEIIDNPTICPSVWYEGELEYRFININSYTATGTTSWICPGGLYSVDYLVVGGGAGGGGSLNAYGVTGGGGGGAGGFLTGSLSVVPGTTYTVTVGAGSAGQGAASTGAATNGSNSVFSSITSAGGGGGGNGFASPDTVANRGQAGGSGGGTGYFSTTGGAGNTPSTSPSQGNNGGAPPVATSVYGSGGGGGAGAAGGAGGNLGLNFAGGNGGAGSSSTISGVSAFYAAGGGAGEIVGYDDSGKGGSGIGGDGQNYSGGSGTGSVNGTTNTGSGGGGGSRGGTLNGGDGGTGIVILSYTKRPMTTEFFNLLTN